MASETESVSACLKHADETTDRFRKEPKRGLMHIATKHSHKALGEKDACILEVITNDANNAVIDSSRATTLPPLATMGVPPNGNLSWDQRTARRPPVRTGAWTTPGNYWYIVHKTKVSESPRDPSPRGRARARNLTSTLSRIQGFGAAPLPGPAIMPS
mmetsp:Transcript_36650/g.67188  ORF Transcript_36650/g.67188 Transcript_36650/m.67188 type:complete len:158 (-) Transcript_36650:67-540(-)